MRIVHSVSEIQAWRDCRQKWEYAFVHNKALPEKGLNLASGTAVHQTIQAVLQGKVGKDRIEGYAEHILTQELMHRNDVHEQVEKFLPGVKRALSKVPEWVWRYEGWHVEESVTVEMVEGVGIKITPDLYRVYRSVEEDVWGKNFEVEWLDVYDFKTGKKDALEYFLTSPQLAYYAVVLGKVYPDAVVRVCYVGLPTQGNSPVDVEPWVLTPDQLAEAERELLIGVEEVGNGAIWPRRGTHCTWCDFMKVTQTRMMGGDWRQVLEEDYVDNEYARRLRE